MEILLGEDKHLLGIMFLIREVVKDMNERGMYNWNLGYPNLEIVQQDIAEKNMYVAFDNGILAGIMTLNEQIPPEHNLISWKFSENKVLVIHRFAVLPLWQNKGIAKEMIQYVEQFAAKSGYSSIRLNISESIFMKKRATSVPENSHSLFKPSNF